MQAILRDAEVAGGERPLIAVSHGEIKVPTHD